VITSNANPPTGAGLRPRKTSSTTACQGRYRHGPKRCVPTAAGSVNAAVSRPEPHPGSLIVVDMQTLFVDAVGADGPTRVEGGQRGGAPTTPRRRSARSIARSVHVVPLEATSPGGAEATGSDSITVAELRAAGVHII
jgi:hypothetical protein